MVLLVAVPENIDTVDRPATFRPAPLFAWIVAFRTTAAEARPRRIPADGDAVELPLIVLSEGRPKPGSPITLVDPVRTMPAPKFPVIVLRPGRSAREWNRRTPKRPSGLLGLVPLPVKVLP